MLRLFFLLLFISSCSQGFQEKSKEIGQKPEVPIDIEMIDENMDENIDFNNCGDDHPLVGESRNFIRRAHGVSGKATILSNCEIKIEEFSFDGGGAGNVVIWGSLNSNFDIGYALSENLFGDEFSNEDFSVFLPEDMSLNDINSLSVWCIPFRANFGSVQF